MFGAIVAGAFILAWSVSVAGFLGYITTSFVQDKIITNY